MKSRILFFLVPFFTLVAQAYGQEQIIQGSTSIDSAKSNNNIQFRYPSLVIPTFLIGYGVVGLINPTLKDININTKNEFREHDDKKVNIDDFSQYSPLLSVYALNAMGIQGKNNFKDRTIVLATAYLIMGSSVSILKKTTRVERPDGSNKKSFPSGHTATAFMGAEFLRREYKNVSGWYGIAGYVIAAGTGFFRMANEKHWLTDVATGAGIGILSTKIAYWVHPLIKKKFLKDKNRINGIVMPFYNGSQYGLGLLMNL